MEYGKEDEELPMVKQLELTTVSLVCQENLYRTIVLDPKGPQVVFQYLWTSICQLLQSESRQACKQNHAHTTLSWKKTPSEPTESAVGQAFLACSDNEVVENRAMGQPSRSYQH
jgi:hypothetical protein